MPLGRGACRERREGQDAEQYTTQHLRAALSSLLGSRALLLPPLHTLPWQALSGRPSQGPAVAKGQIRAGQNKPANVAHIPFFSNSCIPASLLHAAASHPRASEKGSCPRLPFNSRSSSSREEWMAVFTRYLEARRAGPPYNVLAVAVFERPERQPTMRQLAPRRMKRLSFPRSAPHPENDLPYKILTATETGVRRGRQLLLWGGPKTCLL